MGAFHRLTEAAGDKWTWLRKCWALRGEVSELLRAFNASPTKVQVAALEAEKAALLENFEAVRNELLQTRGDAAVAAEEHLAEYGRLKVKYDKRLRATETEQVQAIKVELLAERDAKHLLNIELAAVKEQFQALSADHQIAKDGNLALLRFVHTRHRLNVPFAPGSIRAALQKADQ